MHFPRERGQKDTATSKERHYAEIIWATERDRLPVRAISPVAAA